MKYFTHIVFLLFGLFVNNVRGQDADNTDRHNAKNIYYQSLVRYLDYVNDTSHSVSKKVDTLYIEDDNYFIRGLIDSIGSVKIIKVEKVYEYIKKRHWNGFTLIKMFPLNFENGEFSIDFIPYGVTFERKKRSLNFGNGGGYAVFYRFENNQFYFVRIEDHGI